LALIATKEAVLVFGRKARVIERRYPFKKLLYFAGFLVVEFDRGHIAALRRIINWMHVAPRTAQLWGIQLFLDRRRVTFPRIGRLVEIRGWDKAGGLKIVPFD
jgi:hypothetical protein